MNRYVAPFHTHLAAARSKRSLKEAGIEAVFAPVPRKLSASCGTCLLYQATDPALACMDRDTAAVALICGEDSYQILYQNE